MNDFIKTIAKHIEKLYRSFFIRDILSFVLPGLIYILCFIYIRNEKICINEIKYWIIILVVSYPIGASLQFLGRCLSIVKECKNDDKPSYFKGEMDFLKSISSSKEKYNELLQNNPLYRERLIGIRQMSGNLLMSIICSITLFVISYFLKKYITSNEFWILIIYIIPISIGLWLSQKYIIEDLEIWQKSRIDNI